jgi:uncharacterized protein (DUF2336 family)
MIVPHFLKWVNTAKAGERAAAAGALARAYVQHELPFEDRCAAEAALTLLLDDPSAKVRAALAEALAMSSHAPPQVILALASDQPDVASLVLARSPLLSDTDLIDRLAVGSASTQVLIADRAVVSVELAAAIAEIGEAIACRTLLLNEGADIASLSFRRMAERFGDDPNVRETLIADPRLPGDCRHVLLLRKGASLMRAPLVVGAVGAGRAEKLVKNACAKASLTLLERTRTDDYPLLAEHLIERGDLTTGFILSVVAHGNVDFFGATLVALLAQPEVRVKALLMSGGDVALLAVMRQAGIPENVRPLILRALKAWRDVAAGRRIAGAQEISREMLDEIGGQHASGRLAGLLKTIHLDALRQNARKHALTIAAA